MEIVEVICPSCGAHIDTELGSEKCSCAYCGTTFVLSDEKERTINVNIKNAAEEMKADASIRQAQLQAKQFEHAISYENNLKNIMLLLFIVGTCIIIGSIIFFTNTNEKNYPYAAGVFFVGVLFISGAVATLSDNNENIVRQGKIDIPSELIHYEKKKVDTVINLFKQLGFENITTIELNDLVFSLHENEVETIMIDGTQKWITDRCAYPNSRIVITYHSKRK